MPSSHKAKQAILSLLPDEFQGNIYELGSGWGTLLVHLAMKFPDSQVLGFETSPLPYYLSKLRLQGKNNSNVSVVKLDFFSMPLGEADLIVCYLYPGAMSRLKSKFETELKPGTLIVSNTFAIPGWTPEKVIEVNDLYKTKVYLYRN